MYSLLKTAVVGLLLGMSASAGAATAEPAASTIIDTGQDKLERMTVDVMVNGQGPFPFAVDTGSERTVISASLARRLGLTPNGNAQLHDIAGVDMVRTAQLTLLQVGGHSIPNIRAPVLPDSGLSAMGLLGLDALAGQRVVMDFTDRQMSIRPGAIRDVEDRGTIVVTAKRKFGQLVLVDASVAGKRVYAIVDSGAQVTIGNSALRRYLTKRQRAKSTQTELVSVTGRRLTADIGVLPEMQIGSIKVADIPIVYSDAHPFKKFGLADRPAMLLGANLLRAFERVSLDFNSKKVRFLLRSEESNAGELRLAMVAVD